MKNKGLWLALGLGIGAAGSYYLLKTRHKVRTQCPPFRKRVYSDSREMIEAFGDLWHRPEDIRSLRENGAIGHPLVDKIMLAVAGANGSGSLKRAHMRYAMRHGLNQAEIESLLRGEVEHATVDEAPALFFARHYVETGGHPDPDLVQRLVDTHGARTARDIITCIRLLTFAGLVGNTVDALVSRILGRPSEDTTLSGELGVVTTFSLGVLPLLLVLGVRSALEPAAETGP
ncbi:MAG: hypothetical protein ACOX9A_09970 [Anaerolineae bacterium]|jgi:hypothetical protein